MRYRTCSACGTPVEMRNGRVVSHQCSARPARKPAAKRPGTGRPQRRARDRVLQAARGRCFYCSAPANRADHIVPWISGGSDQEHNLTAACRSCNHLKGDHHLTPRPTIAVVGQIGAGKSTLAAELAQRTGWSVLAIDDYRARGRHWRDLLDDLDRSPAAIVESLATPQPYRLKLILRCALIVQVVVPEAVRQQRIADRSVPRDLYRDGRERAHRTIDGTQPLRDAQLAEITRTATARGRLGPASRAA